MEQFRLDGRVALVTGGSKGLGKSMGLGLAQAGASVAVCSRHGDEAQAVAEEIASATGQKCIGVEADVTKEDDVKSLFAKVTDELGRLDALINSAGMNIRHPIDEFPLEEFRQILDVNLTGTWLCCREAAAIMKKQKGGSIVNVGSCLSAIGLAERTAYCSSKAAILGLTKTLALELAPFGARCNALCPGPFLTEINTALLKEPEKVKALLALTALNRWAELPEIRGAALFLASDASSYMTGAALYLDGGWTAQ
ncbi:MAG: glucose 1-dehydrogenase [Planctomycetes bacterium]|nr:glucose 1-dehydrogenase [Planctomycetota bacterium]